jgi:hypothetical protein
MYQIADEFFNDQQKVRQFTHKRSLRKCVILKTLTYHDTGQMVRTVYRSIHLGCDVMNDPRVKNPNILSYSHILLV